MNYTLPNKYQEVETKKMHRFVISGGLLPTSIDPLEIDQFNNFFPGQMIYHPPLLVTLEGNLESKMLSNFS